MIGALSTALLAALGDEQPPPACPSEPQPALRLPSRPTCAFPTASPASRSTISTTTRGAHSSRWSGRPLRDAAACPPPPTVGAPGPRVFETYKPLWEIFHADGSAPEAAFDSYDAAAHNPCGVAARFGDVMIGSASGIDDIGQAGIGALDPPIVAQNGRYVRTLTLFNQIAFDHIVRNRFYLRERAAAGAEPAARTAGHRIPDGIDRREDARGST